MKTNQAGFTFVEVLVSAALLGALVLATMSVTQLQSKSVLGVNESIELQALVNQAQGVLDTGMTCGGSDLTPNAPLTTAGHNRAPVSMLNGVVGVSDPGAYPAAGVMTQFNIATGTTLIAGSNYGTSLKISNLPGQPGFVVRRRSGSQVFTLAVPSGAAPFLSLNEPFAAVSPVYNGRFMQLEITVMELVPGGVGFGPTRTVVLPFTGLFNAANQLTYCYNRDLSLNPAQICKNSGEVFGQTTGIYAISGYCGPGPSPTDTTVKKPN